MSKPVLFVTGLGKDLQRAENIRTLYEAYDGEKAFISMHDGYYQALNSGKYDLMVVDIFPERKPKKCIMMWHAIQGGKLIGLGQKNGSYTDRNTHSTWIGSLSPVSAVYRCSINVPAFRENGY